MQDMSMGTHSASLSITALSPANLKNSLTSYEFLEGRIALLQAMQTSQEPEQLLQLFFDHIQPLLAISGLRFNFSEPEHDDFRSGKHAPHHCDYRLNIPEGYLGEIIISRNKKFTEDELAQLEVLLTALVYPLHNAINFQAAIRLSLRDPLTGLGNRTALDSALYRELQLAERHQQDLSLLMIDIDCFKKINDVYGHARGDEVLKAVAQHIQAVCRNSDISFRYGGEEFVVLLRKTDSTGARIIAERIRQEIANITLEHNGITINPTVSIGVGTRAIDKHEQIHNLFERADQALYRAKSQGRNCIVDLVTQ